MDYKIVSFKPETPVRRNGIVFTYNVVKECRSTVRDESVVYFSVTAVHV